MRQAKRESMTVAGGLGKECDRRLLAMSRSVSVTVTSPLTAEAPRSPERLVIARPPESPSHRHVHVERRHPARHRARRVASSRPTSPTTMWPSEPRDHEDDRASIICGDEHTNWAGGRSRISQGAFRERRGQRLSITRISRGALRSNLLAKTKSAVAVAPDRLPSLTTRAAHRPLRHLRRDPSTPSHPDVLEQLDGAAPSPFERSASASCAVATQSTPMPLGTSSSSMNRARHVVPDKESGGGTRARGCQRRSRASSQGKARRTASRFPGLLDLDASRWVSDP